MARMRRSSKQTLEYKIEQAEAKVAKTREAHEKAVDELKKCTICSTCTVNLECDKYRAKNLEIFR